MIAFLLDVNVLVALLDEDHVHFERAQSWFEREGKSSWLSCPITQNGVVRIASNSRYNTVALTPEQAIESVRSLTEYGNHAFISDDLSLLNPALIDAAALLSNAQLTDSYLLALAANHGASLATFDKRLVTSAVRSDQKRVYLIP